MSRILLVEDNEMNRDCMQRLLERRGYEVDCAVDGIEAVEAALARTPDLVLMDISLPRMDGYEATRRLRGEALTREVPVIALTALAMPSDRVRAMEAGCCDFETKPVDFPRLMAKIEAHLQGRSR
jgi:two-component system, cell cycle response regulator DivK